MITNFVNRRRIFRRLRVSSMSKHPQVMVTEVINNRTNKIIHWTNKNVTLLGLSYRQQPRLSLPNQLICRCLKKLMS